MAADPGIFQSLLQPVRSVADYGADMDRRELVQEQLQGTKRVNALQALTMDQTRQTMADTQRKQNALRMAVQSAGANADPLKFANTLLSNPDTMDAGVALQKHLADTAEVQARTSKIGGEAQAGSFKLGEDKRKAAIQQAASYNSPDEAIAQLNSAVQSGAMPMQVATAMQRMIQTDPKWQLRLVMGISDPKEMMAALQPHMVSAGGALVNTNPLAGPTGQGVATAIPITQSADNKATVGASMANAAAVRDAARTTGDATRAAANTQRDQATEMKLADDYRAQSKEFGQAQSAHKQLTATLGSATTSPAATLAAATKFMKILDPGSVVRESELGMALAASGILDRAANYISTLQSGQKLTATQAKDFKDISDKMYVAAQQVQQTIDADYKAKAKAYGLRPEMVTQDLGQNSGTVPPNVAAALAKHGSK